MLIKYISLCFNRISFTYTIIRLFFSLSSINFTSTYNLLRCHADEEENTDKYWVESTDEFYCCYDSTWETGERTPQTQSLRPTSRNVCNSNRWSLFWSVPGSPKRSHGKQVCNVTLDYLMVFFKFIFLEFNCELKYK